MTIMITPKRDLYFKNCDPLPENLYGKKGKWYIIREYNNGDLVFTSKTGNDHTYDEETLNKDYYTIDFEKGFSYKFQGQEYFIKDRKWDGKIQVPVETCIINIENGHWEITRYSNEPSKEENSPEKLRKYWCDFVEENSILASFPVPEDDVKKCIYEESLYSMRDLLGDRTLEQFWFEFDKLPEPCNPHNPVKNISREKYYRCARGNPNLCDQFNSDHGILFMSESACGKYYYWEGHNSKNEVIYFRGEKSWVEANYEKREGFEENTSEGEFKTHNNGSLSVPDNMAANEAMDYLCDYADYLDKEDKSKKYFAEVVNSLDDTKCITLKGSLEDKKATLLKETFKPEPSPNKVKSDGGKSDYYKIVLPEWVLEKHSEKGFIMLEDLAEVMFKNDFNFTNVFKAQKRMFELKEGGGKEGNDFDYDATKCKYYIDKQVEVESRK